MTFAFRNPPKKSILARFFKRAYKIRGVIVFLALATLILQYLFFDLTLGQFLNEKYQFDKDNPYVKNLSLKMFLLSKLESIFSIIAAFGTI